MAAPMILKNLRNVCLRLSRLDIRTTSGPREMTLNGCMGLFQNTLSDAYTTIGGNLCCRSAALHTSSVCSDLNEFFDKKENWGKSTVRVGRPYKMDELRLKSSSDLHKLWYVLLKERNMLMTMADEYKRNNELCPSPERLEKVEDSMENILDVVRERDTAVTMLETGEPPLQGRRRWTYNALGIGYWRKCLEYHIPIHMNNTMRKSMALSGPWQHEFIKLRRQREMVRRSKAMRYAVGKSRRLAKVFPDNPDIITDYPAEGVHRQPMSQTLMKGPKLDE